MAQSIVMWVVNFRAFWLNTVNTTILVGNRQFVWCRQLKEASSVFDFGTEYVASDGYGNLQCHCSFEFSLFQMSVDNISGLRGLNNWNSRATLRLEGNVSHNMLIVHHVKS
jgi:hypothetical protein